MALKSAIGVSFVTEYGRDYRNVLVRVQNILDGVKGP
jgi:hypothetical protein